MIIPKWTGSKPNFMTTGSRIGVVMRIDGAAKELSGPLLTR